MKSGAARARLETIARAALQAVAGDAAVRRIVRREGSHLEVAGSALPDTANVYAIAAGKAACAMARALEQEVGDRLVAGWAVTKDGHAEPLDRFSVREAAHPVPDARGEAAALELLEVVASLNPDDVLVVLLSGGASALLGCPPQGIGLADVVAVNECLLACGADIAEMNAVRKHLSRIAGGRLAAATACSRIEVLAISDVPGDRMEVIASGPFSADSSRFQDALQVIDRYGIESVVGKATIEYLKRGAAGQEPESVKPGDPRLEKVDEHVIATNRDAMRAAAVAAESAGMRAVSLGPELVGEASDAGRRIASLAVTAAAEPGERPLCLLAGGETTVTLRGAGLGGRSQELALAAATVVAGRDGVGLLALGTDGTDGPTDAAGAYVDGETVERGRLSGVDAARCLQDNDSYRFFDAEGGLVRTGPTGTNVMDLVLVGVERIQRR